MCIEVSKIPGPLFKGPYNKDYGVLVGLIFSSISILANSQAVLPRYAPNQKPKARLENPGLKGILGVAKDLLPKVAAAESQSTCTGLDS